MAIGMLTAGGVMLLAAISPAMPISVNRASATAAIMSGLLVPPL